MSGHLKGKLLRHEPMARYTSFRIGGEADLFFEPLDEEDLKEGIRYAKDKGISWFILGNGSNILVSDQGIRPLVIHLSASPFRKMIFKDTILTVGAGAKTGTVLHECVERNFGGVEFLGAIPGTLGGVFYMNGGTYLGDVSEVTLSVTFLDELLNRRTLPKQALEFGYRKSVFQDKSWVILEGRLSLTPRPEKEAKRKVLEILDRRRKTQPLKVPSAGSAFKNPPNQSAWRLIEEAGLRGFSIGDAVVSDTHTNFIVNKGKAKAADVFKLIRTIQERVRGNTGILLEPEVRLVGEWSEEFLHD